MYHFACHCGNINVNGDHYPSHNHTFEANNCTQKCIFLGSESITVTNPARIAVVKKSEDRAIMICKKCGESFQILKNDENFICVQDKNKNKSSSYIISENNDDCNIPESLTNFFYSPCYFCNTETSDDQIDINNDTEEYDNSLAGSGFFYDMSYFYGSLTNQWAHTMLPLIDA